MAKSHSSELDFNMHEVTPLQEKLKDILKVIDNENLTSVEKNEFTKAFLTDLSIMLDVNRDGEFINNFIQQETVNKISSIVSGAHLLHYAASVGNIDLVKHLIEYHKLQPNLETDNQTTPLHFAAASGHLHVVQYLGENCKVNLDCYNKNRDTPLHFAAANRHVNVMHYLIKVGKVDHSPENCEESIPFHNAILLNHTDVIEFYVNHFKENPNILSNGTYSSAPLHDAVFMGNMIAVKYLIEDCKADPYFKDEEGNNSFVIAIETHKDDIFKYLVEKCNIIDIPEEWLTDAIIENSPGCFRICIERGVDKIIGFDNEPAGVEFLYELKHTLENPDARGGRYIGENDSLIRLEVEAWIKKLQKEGRESMEVLEALLLAYGEGGFDCIMPISSLKRHEANGGTRSYDADKVFKWYEAHQDYEKNPGAYFSHCALTDGPVENVSSLSYLMANHQDVKDLVLGLKRCVVPKITEKVFFEVITKYTKQTEDQIITVCQQHAELEKMNREIQKLKELNNTLETKVASYNNAMSSLGKLFKSIAPEHADQFDEVLVQFPIEDSLVSLTGEDMTAPF